MTVVLSVVAMLLNSVAARRCRRCCSSARRARPGPPLPAARAEGLHHRGRRRTPGSTPRSPRPSRAPAPSRRSASRGTGCARGDDDIAVSGAGRALHDDAAQPALRRHRRRVQRAARGHAAASAPSGYAQGWVTLGQITTAMLYVEALCGPLDRLVGDGRPAAGRRRLDRPGCSASPTVPPDREAGDRPARPAPSWSARTCASPTAPATTCCTASTSTSRTGERLAIVGPERLRQVDARPAAGRHQRPAHRLGHGRRRRARRRCRWTTLRTEVALVTQEHHVFVGTVRDNIVLAPRGLDRRRGAATALRAVGAARLGRAAARRARHQARLGPPGADPGPGPADRAGPADHRRPAHAGARRGDLADRPAHGPHTSRAR